MSGVEPGERATVDESLFRALVEHAPDAVLVITLEGAVVWANAAVPALFGREREEVVGASVADLVPTRLHDRLAAGLARYADSPSARALGSVEAGSGLAVLRGDGTEVRVDVSATPVEVHGRLLVGLTLRDAGRRRAVETLFRDLLEAAPDGMVIVDGDGTVVLVNEQAERMFGWARAELVGQPVEVLVPQRYRAAHPERRAVFSAAATHRPMGHEQLFARRRDGSQFPVDISLSPLTTADGVLYSAAVRDVTERQRLRDDTERLRDELVATVSHELRTPLTSIIGYAELLAELGEDELGPVARQLLAVVQRNANRELSLVDDLLTLASVHAQQLDVGRDPVDLQAVLAAAAESFGPVVADAGLELRTDLAPVPAVAGDAGRLSQLVDNLLTNAVKFTPRGGRLRLGLTAEDGTALITVSDSGVGMSEAEARLVFERLYRAPSAVAAHVQGAGLGLSIVRAVVEAHDGRVEVTSTPGQGSTFSVWLPLAGQGAAP